jgi:hypothetical protein
MTKKKYTYDYLISNLNKVNAKIIGIYDILKINTTIYFICKCGKESNKSFKNIVDGNGAYCNSCTKLIKQVHVFNIELLNTVIKRDNAILLELYDIVSRNTKIKYKCICGNEYIKYFRLIVESGGAFCKKCTQYNRLKKLKNTSIIRFGTEYASQSIGARTKFINTCQIKYGCNNPNQNIIIQERSQKNLKIILCQVDK